MNLNFKSDPRTNQDKWIVDLTNGGMGFGSTLNKTAGYFIEAGACDGLSASNTYVLEKELNWKGICVEPNNKWFNELIKNRDACENVALYSKDGEIDFVECNYRDNDMYTFEDADMKYYSGIKEHIYQQHKSVTDKGTIIKKPCMTLENLLDKHETPFIIDYVSLDTEGSEYEILKSFPFNTYPKQIMAFSIEEAYNYTRSDSCCALLNSIGYIEVKNKFSNADHEHYYVHPSHTCFTRR
jgi:FkbM family methyltransferase